MKQLVLSLIFLVLINEACAQTINLRTSSFEMKVDAHGRITGLDDIGNNQNYLAEAAPSYLMAIRMNGEYENPSAAKWNSSAKTINLTYAKYRINAVVRVEQKKDYLTFELIKIDRKNDIDLVLWGPYATTIAETVGETVGVVRNGKYAIGIQALNIRTLGGYPSAEHDIQPAYDIFKTSNLVDISDDEMNRQSFRGDVAAPKDFGSVLQAYCRNRNKDRVIENWDHEKYFVPAFNDEGIVGSRIAVFGAPEKEVLDLLGRLEVNEKLPHPMLDGVWGKRSPIATSSYLIMNFGEINIAEAVDITKKAGLKYLYHGDAFETWGHFKMKPAEFPDNWQSFRRCANIASAKDVRLGLHTLSNFITTNDPYVTPVPDQRLAKVGSSLLVQNISATDKEIVIADPTFFNQMKNNNLKSVMVGTEIIRYARVSEKAPWVLEDCTRGAFGTKASAHSKNDVISKLMDHGYKVFLTNYDLQEEVAKTVAKMCNEAGIMQISFDGLEGTWATGMGQYARQLFTKTWYDNLSSELKGKVINDASNPGHFFWHIYTRMNWGEPWYAGFRESQVQYRLKNQEYFRRNLMPSMLGWFSLNDEATLEDVEWLLARAAGFDAGFGLSANLASLNKHGRRDIILDKIKEWESARMAGVFSQEQKKELRDIKKEFTLDKNGEKRWVLTPIYNAYFQHQQKIKQPGEPVFSEFEFDNKGEKQPLSFTITPLKSDKSNDSGEFGDLFIEINDHQRIDLPIKITAAQILYCNGKELILYDKQWHELKRHTLGSDAPMLEKGLNKIVFDAHYNSENGPALKIEVRTKGAPMQVGAK